MSLRIALAFDEALPLRNGATKRSPPDSYEVGERVVRMVP